MQITKVKVDDLYGLHHYEIEFDVKACIKIIHAPNGYGKTTLLKLIDYVMYYRLEEILNIPFRKFEITFGEDLVLQVVKQGNDDCEQLEYIILEAHQKSNYQCILDKYKREVLVEKDLMSKLETIREQMPIHLIKANRLLAEDVGEKTMPAVLRYAKELSEQMKDVLARSAKLHEELDCHFPNALLQISHEGIESNTTYQEIQLELEAIDEKRKALEKLGLLTVTHRERVILTETTPKHILRTLELYIVDSKKKLAVFDELSARMALMQELIDKRFTYKKMCLSQQEGFMFEVPYNGKLHADKLSSGEQNELILIFELLFKASQNALILIDEPEISLHIAWQQSFLEDMEKIAALTGVKLIIATHSPDIINGRWDLTTGLEEC